MKYIYALSEEVFDNEQDYYDRSPRTQYFYVGFTKDLERREQQHAGEARRGSQYPVYKRIRELGDSWQMEKLAAIEDGDRRSCEDY